MPKARPKDREYHNLHYFIRRVMGTPSICDDCGTTDNRRYEWANISGDYKWDLLDWKRLCVPCHKKLDEGARTYTHKTHCLRGHGYTRDNTINRADGSRQCRECKNWTRREKRKLNPPRQYASTSGHRGIYWNSQRQIWQAHVHLDNRSVYVGSFGDKDEAIAARQSFIDQIKQAVSA